MLRLTSILAITYLATFSGGAIAGETSNSFENKFLNLNSISGIYEVSLEDKNSSLTISLSCFGSKGSNCQYVTSSSIGDKPPLVSDSRWVESFQPIDMEGIRRALAYSKSNSNKPYNPADKPILDLVRPAIASVSDVELCGDLRVGGSNATVVCRTVEHAGSVSPPMLLQFNSDMGPCGPVSCGYLILPLNKVVTSDLRLPAGTNYPAGIQGGTTYASYSMQFRRWDRPTINVIDYQYSANGKVFNQWSRSMLSEGRNPGSQGYYGRSPIPEKLYVKWKLEATGEIFEDTADLQGKLPKSMEQKTLYFLVWDKQLNIYIKDQEKLINNDCVPLAYYKKNGSPIFNSADEVVSSRFCENPLLKVYPNHLELNKER